MSFIEVIDQITALLRERKRISYRVLKREYDLTDDDIEDLKEELIHTQEVAAEKDGRMLIWQDNEVSSSTPTSPPPQSQPPASYTPQHLAERIRAEQQAMESRGRADGERKTITALFADLKGSTALIEGLDPEEARAIIDPALQLMMDAVHRYDGYVAQALGDGIFALFGAPIAHEDHPQRALYAALRMQEEMRGYSDQSRLKGGIPLQMRVGINTGEVVVRSIRKDDLHTDYVPVGHSTNLAARMEQIATPGSIVVSEYTRKLTEGYFALKALGAAEIKGVEEPLNVYEVLGAGPLRTRLQVSARRGLTRFVGRHNEMEQLQTALEQAKAGHGQIVGVLGEPGLGKSRLFYEFKLTSQSGCLVLEAFAVSHGQNSPYLPLIELLKTYFQIDPTDDERARKEKINGKVITLDRSLEDTLPYLLSLLGIEDKPSSLQQMDAQIRRQRTFEALKKLFLRESLNQPLILVFEDLHWIDSETQGFLDTLTDSVASANLLLLVNYRPEYRHEWGQKTYYTQLHLSPLGKREREELLTFLLGDDASLDSLKPRILDKTEGTPFFLEEVVQTLVEEGVLTGERGQYRQEQDRTDLHIPATVQGILASRIDRLAGAEKELLQQLSIIGRQFPASLVKQIVSQTEDEIYRLLSSLQTKEFVYAQPAFPEVEYVFKHALTQEVAYGTVLQEQRKAVHERTGQAIEVLHTDNVDDHYSELAHHYSRSDNTEKAVEYLSLAGTQATQRSAPADAVTHFTQALEILKTLPVTPECMQRELMLQVSLGAALYITKSGASSEVERALLRGEELCQHVEDRPEHSAVLFALHRFYATTGEFRRSAEVAQRHLRIAQRLDAPTFLLSAHVASGAAELWLGEFVSARTHLEEAAARYDPQQHEALIALYADDFGVVSGIFGAFALWSLGYPTQAVARLEETMPLAELLSHPFSIGETLFFGAIVYQARGEVAAVRKRCEAALAVSEENGFPFMMVGSTLVLGWARAQQGEVETGIAQMREGLAAWKATGARLWQPYFLSLLTEAYLKAGQADAGLKVVAEAMTEVQRSDGRQHEAELHRLKGDLLLQQSPDNHQDAEACFHTAIAIAQKQQAKSWELRAATSLARLWQQQGKTAEARDLLAPVYDWFTEGFDTADLKDAKALLGELS